jgi:hypothetical protein
MLDQLDAQKSRRPQIRSSLRPEKPLLSARCVCSVRAYALDDARKVVSDDRKHGEASDV